MAFTRLFVILITSSKVMKAVCIEMLIVIRITFFKKNAFVHLTCKEAKTTSASRALM